MLASITRFATLFTAVAILVSPTQDVQAQDAVCKATYQTIFDRLTSKGSNKAKVSDAEISWALSYEKAVNAGESCPPIPAAVRSAVQPAASPKPASQSVPRKSDFEQGMSAHKAGQYPKALGHFEQACAQGSGAGCWNAGLYYAGNFETPKDWAKARQIWIEGCGYNDAKSCRKSAMMARDGDGGPVNYQLTEANGQIGCSLGEKDSCSMIGNLRRYGRLNGGQGNWREALPYFEKGCKLDGAISCYLIAELFKKGYQDYPKKHEQARTLYAKACRLGHQGGCNGEALMLGAGLGGPKDEAGARAILKASCDKKYGVACSNLSAYYQKGRGGPVDLAKASETADLACKYGFQIRCPKD